MLFKLFTISALVYILYRISSTPRFLSGDKKSAKKDIDEGDYVDYEEVE